MSLLQNPQSAFFASQAVLILGILWLLFRKRVRTDESQFQLRESDRPKASARERSKLALPHQGEKPTEKKTGPALLSGIQPDAAPHVVLGIAPDAGREEIQKAYRERMKQYHPDRIGRPGSREWADAQKIAEAINRAKDEMLKKTRL